jgi:hypothetical protein
MPSSTCLDSAAIRKVEKLLLILIIWVSKTNGGCVALMPAIKGQVRELSKNDHIVIVSIS